MQPRKKLLIILCLIVILAGTVTLLAQSTLANFGINTREVQPRVVNSLVNGYVPVYPNRKTFLSATPAIRAAFVKEALTWVKAYTESQAFLDDYKKQRESAKPTPPASKGTPDEQFAKNIAEQRKAVEEMKKNVAKMSSQMQKQMADTVKQMEINVERMAKDPQMAAMLKQGFAAQAQGEQQDYQRRLADHEKRYPADPKVLIASRLRQFLDLSKDVDFSAKLVPAGGGTMKFADPKYEAKSDQWKLCYRAGRDAVEVGRAFAMDWLKQLGTK